MRPEDALPAARAEAARRDYSEPEGLALEPAERVTRERLLAWAVIEPDADELRSTRRAGAPITWLKRALLRALRQYHGQIVAQQTRFNLQVVAQLTELEDRIERLERER